MEENIESESRVFECLSVTCTPLRTERQVGEHHFCKLSIEKVKCDDEEYPVGPTDGCYCCFPPAPES
ncbi:hypothetical protein FHG87_013938 [Trinorchestia longiramus]|nr:hypothetical protein FHG87_013938 [Trinorchestia longiramus]